ncbi:bifunctional phosphopantothenoylcysteine decarboxylase/phosphopantothenate--cysteine ligase CoaBC [Methanosphaera sp. ISO3-F5]|uniref:bifunctional phosphopantothenoylcysteine decarboxylase/phosphopantothenate--cysteine ligase CoaBC n=1 Tax=Methanosphaera sp. ISO3-F5 TaxID=1452353 RepID=UPI002B25C90C|nr:bifunctional phosphopantothenoylcysteine decarboxylase/phosphopantothenate--cysteine ligase CoaBC [Methanosphaera sp. ISO3-F5]WQH64743.1 bifunctional phosphopantothenoylcysteine decarboxylase/phosphopantothenate--cysteine ligase CoaBC [Methanosphaera sp. ISO3-F5]
MKIILCITGSIAATEDLKLVHELKRHGYEVECFMTEAATEIITPLSMEFATKNPVITKITGYVEHVTRAQADLILVAPATANTISKFAHKIADTTVTTLLLTASGYDTPILFVPSMHISMYEAISDNVEKIKEDNEHVYFMEPNESERKAKFPSRHDIVLEVERLTGNQKLAGKNVLVSTGATFEAMDAMRGITNRSSGKMGVEIAKEAYRQGANVTLICGLIRTHVPKLFHRIDVESTREMMDVLKEKVVCSDVYVSAAAISDFSVGDVCENKISSDDDVTVHFTRLPKLLKQIKVLNPDTFVVGFKAEAGVSEEFLIEKAVNRMNNYGTDIIVANDILVEDGGPGSDNNEVYLVDRDGYEKYCLDTKENISKRIVEKVCSML